MLCYWVGFSLTHVDDLITERLLEALQNMKKVLQLPPGPDSLLSLPEVDALLAPSLEDEPLPEAQSPATPANNKTLHLGYCSASGLQHNAQVHTCTNITPATLHMTRTGCWGL
jgi:hypothetical protein